MLVRWGPRRFLVEPDRMDRFVNLVNRGVREWLRNSFWMREPEDGPPFEGLPEVPAEDAHKLFATARSGSLDSVRRVEDPLDDDADHCTFEVELDAGRAAGAWEEMQFVLLGDSTAWDGVVTAVSDDQATALVRCGVQARPFGDEVHRHATPAIGWRWSTRPEDASSSDHR